MDEEIEQRKNHHKKIPGAELREYKMRARRAAKELGYVYDDPDILDKINDAKTELEVTRIMRKARGFKE